VTVLLRNAMVPAVPLPKGKGAAIFGYALDDRSSTGREVMGDRLVSQRPRR